MLENVKRYLAGLHRASKDCVDLAGVIGPPAAFQFAAATLRSLPTVIRERDLKRVDKSMSGAYSVRCGEHTLLVDCSQIDHALPAHDCPTFAGIREMFGRSVYTRAFAHGVLARTVVVDGGANRGLFTAYAAQMSSIVVSVEPQRLYRPALSILLQANSIPDERVIRYDTFLTDVTVPGKSVSLEAILWEHSVERIGFLKMDVEGAEFSIFARPEHWLDRVDNIAMEVHGNYGNPAEIIRTLKHFGHDVLFLDHHGKAVAEHRADYIYSSRVGSIAPKWKGML